MCLSLRLRCLLLLNGGRQGDCVRVEFWLRETLLQRLEPVADLIRLHDAGHQAVIGSPSSAAATMTGIEGTSVLRGSGLHVS